MYCAKHRSTHALLVNTHYTLTIPSCHTLRVFPGCIASGSGHLAVGKPRSNIVARSVNHLCLQRVLSFEHERHRALLHCTYTTNATVTQRGKMCKKRTSIPRDGALRNFFYDSREAPQNRQPRHSATSVKSQTPSQQLYQPTKRCINSFISFPVSAPHMPSSSARHAQPWPP